METKAESEGAEIQVEREEAITQQRIEVTKVQEQNIGANMSDKMNGEKMFDSFTKLSESVFSLDGLKKAAAWYIETGERVANQAIEMQEKATTWAKDTPLAPIFEAQNSIARRLVERSASAARNIWQIQA